MGYRIEWHEETKQVERVVGATCDNCGAEMEPVWPNEEREWENGAHNALPITLHGYFDGYFDCDGDPRALLCEECANKLAAAFPFVRKAIDSTLPF